MKIFKGKNKVSWYFTKFLYIANDISGILLNKERKKQDKRVRNLSIALIILAAVLIVSFAYNVYLATGA